MVVYVQPLLLHQEHCCSCCDHRCQLQLVVDVMVLQRLLVLVELQVVHHCHFHCLQVAPLVGHQSELSVVLKEQVIVSVMMMTLEMVEQQMVVEEVRQLMD